MRDLICKFIKSVFEDAIGLWVREVIW